MPREKVIPWSKKELSSLLARRFDDGGRRDGFLRFCGLIGEAYHHRFYRLLEDFKASYLPVDPDLNVRLMTDYSGEQLAGLEKESVGHIERILVAANYERISAEALSKAFGQSSPWGLDLKVDTTKYELMSLFYRGEYPDHLEKKVFFINRHFDFSVYNRVVLVFKLREATAEADNKAIGFQKGKLYLKIFKNVPTVDIEMLFPDTEVVIRPVDKAKVIVPLAAGAATTAYKIASYALSEGNPVHLWSQIGFWILVGSLFGVALKGFMTYKTTIEKYLKTLTTSLYFQNLDNNAGVFKYLLDEAEEEECKELILAYYFLLSSGGTVKNLGELDRMIEEFFRAELQTDLDFEVDDAFRKLVELGLLSSGEGLVPLALDEAIAKLEGGRNLT